MRESEGEGGSRRERKRRMEREGGRGSRGRRGGGPEARGVSKLNQLRP